MMPTGHGIAASFFMAVAVSLFLLSCNIQELSKVCQPADCASLDRECGDHDDGCGSTASCGACPLGGLCESGVCVEQDEGCVPETCQSSGVDCGPADDGCGSLLDCGTCSPGGLCESGVCVEQDEGCVPETCQSLGVDCGPADDGCDDFLDCGDCSDGQRCRSGICVDRDDCTPAGCVAFGYECGLHDDGCEGTVDCGTCLGQNEDCLSGVCVSTEPPLVPENDLSVLRAFPGAEGNASLATGGRGGRVIEVTNLNDSGPGSFREALLAIGPRIVIFRVGGTIVLESQIVLGSNQSDLTIAGQTAPGGIQVVANPETWTGQRPLRHVLSIWGANNVIIRYMTFRGTACDGCRGSSDVVTFGGGSTHVILDHVSLYWAWDETIGQSSGNHITIQNSIIAEAFAGHAVAILLQQGMDIHHNLMTGHTHRHPVIGAKGSARVMNNLIYQGNRGTHSGGGATLDIIGNHYKLMPGQPASSSRYFNLGVGTTDSDDPTPLEASVYIAGNKDAWDNIGPDEDQWLLVVRLESHAHSNPAGAYPMANPGDTPIAWRRSQPLDWQGQSITLHHVDDLESLLLPHVGNSMGLDEEGFWVDRRDAHDVRVVEEWRTNTRAGSRGIIAHEDEVGGYAAAGIVAKTPYADTAGDGIADAWRLRNGFEAADHIGSLEVPGFGGWTYLDIFLAGMDLP